MLTPRGPVVHVSVPVLGLLAMARLIEPDAPDGRMLPPASAMPTIGCAGNATPATPRSGCW